MKRLRKMDNNLTLVGVWSLRLILITVIWGVVVKFTDLSFMLELGTKTLNVTNQMLLNGTFVALVILVGVIIVCTLLECIVNGLMKIKRRKMKSL